MSFFFFNDTATTEIYTLSLHDALPISESRAARLAGTERDGGVRRPEQYVRRVRPADRSEEHTSELQSQSNLVCRLLLEKKRKTCKPLGNLLRSVHPPTHPILVLPYCAV